MITPPAWFDELAAERREELLALVAQYAADRRQAEESFARQQFELQQDFNYRRAEQEAALYEIMCKAYEDLQVNREASTP